MTVTVAVMVMTVILVVVVIVVIMVIVMSVISGPVMVERVTVVVTKSDNSDNGNVCRSYSIGQCSSEDDDLDWW